MKIYSMIPARMIVRMPHFIKVILPIPHHDRTRTERIPRPGMELCSILLGGVIRFRSALSEAVGLYHLPTPGASGTLSLLRVYH